jgi:hypothetical protein
MPDASHSGAVRVLDTNGRTVGVGVLVGPRTGASPAFS